MIYRVVLDVQLADANPARETIGAHERREAGVEAGAGLTGNGQQLPIAPQVLRSLFDDFARQPDRRIVVNRLERSETTIANVEGLCGKICLANVTLQADQRVHPSSIFPGAFE